MSDTPPVYIVTHECTDDPNVCNEKISQVPIADTADLLAQALAEIDRLHAHNARLTDERNHAYEVMAKARGRADEMEAENTKLHDRINADAERLSIMRSALRREVVSLHKWHGHGDRDVMECQACADSEQSVRMVKALKEAQS